MTTPELKPCPFCGSEVQQGYKKLKKNIKLGSLKRGDIVWLLHIQNLDMVGRRVKHYYSKVIFIDSDKEDACVRYSNGELSIVPLHDLYLDDPAHLCLK